MVGSGSDGIGGGLGLDVDEESLALAREAAKKEDYEWFMEFIGTGEEDDGRGAPAPSSSSSNDGSSSSGGDGGGSTSTSRYGDETRQGRTGQSYYDNVNSSSGSSRRQAYMDNGRDNTDREYNPRLRNHNVYDDDNYNNYSSSPYYDDNNNNDYDTGSTRAQGDKKRPPRSRGYPAPKSQSPTTGGVDTRGGQRLSPPPPPPPTPRTTTISTMSSTESQGGEAGITTPGLLRGWERGGGTRTSARYARRREPWRCGCRWRTR